MKRMLMVLITMAFAGSASALEIYDQHPRIFVHAEQLPLLRARCGIADGDNQSTYATQWNSHAEEYQALVGEIAEYTVEDAPNPDREWPRDVIKAMSDRFANVATAYLLNAHRSAGDPYGATLIDWWTRAVEYSRNQNGGEIDQCIISNYFGKNAVWKGFVMAYDYLYDELPPTLRDEVAEWLLANTKDGFQDIHGDESHPPEVWNHYYKLPWLADCVFTVLLATWGDPEVSDHASEYPQMLEYTHAFKVLDNEARAKNMCGTYSGYRWERPEEDVATALAWQSAIVDENPFVTYGYHFRQLDDWVMYMTRPNFYESDETGHDVDLARLHSTFVDYSYPSAVMDGDPYTLWFLDRASEEMSSVSNAWLRIFYNDKSLPRRQPTHDTVPLGRFFGDLSPEDGYNSQYTHMRSTWAYSAGDQGTVMASYLCGPRAHGHDLLSNGHLAIFRGQDIITSSTGVYDGTNFRHTIFYSQAPLSENSILVIDPNNPYLDQPAGDSPFDSTGSVYNREGMQTGTEAGGTDVIGADDAFAYGNEFGFVRRFKNTDQFDTYLYSDITSAYPNTKKIDLWPSGQTVDNVSRQIVFEVGKYFVVCDRVSSVNPAATKRVIMHNPSKDGYTLVDGTWNGGTAPHAVTHGGTPGQTSDNAVRYFWTKGSSRAYATVLYPEPAARGGEGRKIRRVGGTNSQGDWNQNGSNPSYEFWLEEWGENPTWQDQYINGGEYTNYYEVGWAGFWRMEIEATGAKDHTFLHVYEITSSGQASPTPVDYLDNVQEGRVGCIVRHPGNHRVNVFSRDEELDSDAVYGALSDQPINHLVADLVPGTYAVRDELSSFETTVLVDEASLATFRSPHGGYFRLTRADDGEALANLASRGRLR
jgi:hypothetical protein